LAGVVEHRFVLRGLADLLEGGNRHRAKRPMMTTTIMISTSVKPLVDLLFSYEVSIFIYG